MNDLNLDKIKNTLLKEVRNDKRVISRKRFLPLMKYAAIALLFLVIGMFMRKDIFDGAIKETIVPNEDVIKLQLSNGEIKIIEKDGSSLVLNESGRVVGKQMEEKLVYERKNNTSESEYNTLSIPNGKRFGIVLSDGTKVHLNAGSSITYPIAFSTSGSRKVYLSGEAFFEVSHSDKQQFIVNAQELDVKVYGTKFNVTSYPEDKNAKVVLVDGSVSLSQSDDIAKKEEVFLNPGYMGSFSKINKTIVDEKVNTELYTSWMTGNLIFRNESFQNIIQKLERHYNVVIINNNKELGSETFNATIETKNETIEQVFNYFDEVYDIKYRIVENKIIIS